jgi:hypothetical protein
MLTVQALGPMCTLYSNDTSAVNKKKDREERLTSQH